MKNKNNIDIHHSLSKAIHDLCIDHMMHDEYTMTIHFFIVAAFMSSPDSRPKTIMHANIRSIIDRITGKFDDPNIALQEIVNILSSHLEHYKTLPRIPEKPYFKRAMEASNAYGQVYTNCGGVTEMYLKKT